MSVLRRLRACCSGFALRLLCLIDAWAHLRTCAELPGDDENVMDDLPEAMRAITGGFADSRGDAGSSGGATLAAGGPARYVRAGRVRHICAAGAY